MLLNLRGKLSCWVLILCDPGTSTEYKSWFELLILGFDDAGFKAMLMEK